jgi:hypothetical protein
MLHYSSSCSHPRLCIVLGQPAGLAVDALGLLSRTRHQWGMPRLGEQHAAGEAFGCIGECSEPRAFSS